MINIVSEPDVPIGFLNDSNHDKRYKRYKRNKSNESKKRNPSEIVKIVKVTVSYQPGLVKPSGS